MRALRPRRAGVTLAELFVVIALIGILAAIAFPRMRPGATQTVTSAATQLVRDLEQVRGRALAARRLARVVFLPAQNAYTWTVDVTGDSIFDAGDSAAAGPGMTGSRTLPAGITFGRGTASQDVPLYAGSGAIVFPGSQLTLDDRGLTFPALSQGVVYLTSASGSYAGAVSVSGAGSFRAWSWTGSAWR